MGRMGLLFWALSVKSHDRTHGLLDAVSLGLFKVHSS